MNIEQMIELSSQLDEVYGMEATEAVKLEVQSKAPGLDEDLKTRLADQVLDRMTDIQRNIDKIVDIAIDKIRRKISYLQYLETYWQPFLRAYGKEILEKHKDTAGHYKRKSFKLTSGGLFFRKTGGWKITNTREVEQYALEEIEKTRKYPEWAQAKIAIDRYMLLRHVGESGEIVPGVEYEPENELGQLKVGATKAWSARPAVSKLRNAFTATLEEEEED